MKDFKTLGVYVTGNVYVKQKAESADLGEWRHAVLPEKKGTGNRAPIRAPIRASIRAPTAAESKSVKTPARQPPRREAIQQRNSEPLPGDGFDPLDLDLEIPQEVGPESELEPRVGGDTGGGGTEVLADSQKQGGAQAEEQQQRQPQGRAAHQERKNRCRLAKLSLGRGSQVAHFIA